MEECDRTKLKKKARDIRKMAIEAICGLGIGHIGGSMSIVETLVILYHKFMRIDPKNPRMVDRDRLVMSKGHAGPALYSILADLGSSRRNGCDPQPRRHAPAQPLRHEPHPGIDMTTGPLGQGLSAAIGMAIASRMDKLPGRIYAIIGDGECNEGQVWEAAQAAAHFKLSNITVFLDYNKMGLDGWLADVMDISDITAKWVAFEWFVQRVDGHDFDALERAILAAQETRVPP